MTPCEELGYKVGDSFEVTGEKHHMFSVGDVVVLTYDDGSDTPKFTRNSDFTSYIYLGRVKKITNSEGWIEWKGGKCPVKKGTLVDVKYRDGIEIFSLPALLNPPYEENNTFRDASCSFWCKHGERNDIIAYRLSEPQKVDGGEVLTEHKSYKVDWSLDIITLISMVAPTVSVSDALEIANTLQENGFKK